MKATLRNSMSLKVTLTALPVRQTPAVLRIQLRLDAMLA